MEQRVQHNLFVTPPPAAWRLKIPRENSRSSWSAYRDHVSTGCSRRGVGLCLRRIYGVAIRIPVSRHPSGFPFFFFFFFFFLLRKFNTRFVDWIFVDPFLRGIYFSRKGCCTVSFFYGNNNEISSVFVYYLLFFKEFGIFFQSLNSRWRNLRKNFYSAITGVSLC